MAKHTTKQRVRLGCLAGMAMAALFAIGAFINLVPGGMSLAFDNDSGLDLCNVRVEYDGGILFMGNIGKKWLPVDVMSYKRIYPTKYGSQYTLRYSDKSGEEYSKVLKTEYGPDPEWFGSQIIRFTDTHVYLIGKFVRL